LKGEARIGLSFQSVSEARPDKFESNVLYLTIGMVRQSEVVLVSLFGSTLVVKKQKKDFKLKKTQESAPSW
jgi:hypothetical protein